MHLIAIKRFVSEVSVAAVWLSEANVGSWRHFLVDWRIFYL